MKRITHYSCLLFFTITLQWQCQSAPETEIAAQTKFELLTPSVTGIDFVNRLENTSKANIFMYEYFYNGGGVAAGDLNGDGLDDLYFTANMGDNRLYINKGQFSFEDATILSGAGGRPGPWKTGVTFVDINGDGRLDLYLSYSGLLSEKRRSGQLFINQGNNNRGIPIFTDHTDKAGLDFPVQGHQAYFFDYDHDQDLDLFLLNHNRKPLPPMDDATIQSMLRRKDKEQGLRLLQNNPSDDGFPVFTDVTEKAGIPNSSLSYGLAAGIADVNGDGWEDIYVSNDYIAPDYLLINTQKAGFTNELNKRIRHTSHFSMGNDMADINNDGWTDIISLDMLPEDNARQKLLLGLENYEAFDVNLRNGLGHQYMRNMLHLNLGEGRFTEIGQLSGISNTDWSWAPLFADFDNDGHKDLVVTNGYLRDFTNQDFVKYVGNYMGRAQGRLSEEMILELVSKMPASKVSNYLFRNTGNLALENVTAYWGLERSSNSNGAVWSDLDNDGDLELVVNNLNETAFIYRNHTRETTESGFIKISLEGEGLNTLGIGASIRIHNGQSIQLLRQMPTRGYLSSVSPILHAGIGNTKMVDSIVVQWPSGKRNVLPNVKADQWILLKEAEATTKSTTHSALQQTIFKPVQPILFQHVNGRYNDFKRQPLMVSPQSITGPCMAKADVNNDGYADVCIGGGKGQAAALFLGTKYGGFNKLTTPDFEADKAYADTDVAFLDANGDGNTDLYIASGGYHHLQPADPLLQDRLYLNDGKGNFKRASKALPSMLINTGAVAIFDANLDGNPDIFVGGKNIPGQYPLHPESFLLINDGNGQFTNQIGKWAPALKHAGMVTDAAVADLNADSQPELILCGEWMPIRIFEKTDTEWKDVTSRYFHTPLTGFWNTIHIRDLTNDGIPEIIAGNWGLNSQVRASKTTPATLHYKDFDANGSIDPIFGFPIQGKNFPYVTRDELLDQLVPLRSRFPDYRSFANATISELFYPEEMDRLEYREINTLETVLLSRKPDSQFVCIKLPLEAQLSPVFAVASMDLNKDAFPDLLLMGNQSESRIRIGKMDANPGTILLADKQGQYTAVPSAGTGIYIHGDTRSILPLGDTILIGVHNETVRSFVLTKKR